MNGSSGGGSIVRALSGKRDAVIFVYPGWVEEEDKWAVLGDPANLSVSLNDGNAKNLPILYHPFDIWVSNGSAKAKLAVFAVPIDFPSTIRSGKIKLELTTYYKTCNNITLAVIYFHDTGRGEYQDLVILLSAGFGRGFPVLPDFRAEFNFTVNAPEMSGFLRSAVNAHHLDNWIEEPKGWLVVKTVNVTVCPPKTS